MKRVLLTVLSLLALAGCSSSVHHAARRPGTAVRTFQAYDAKGNLTAVVADVAVGSCWTTSVADPVAGAFRCLSGNRIYDPCFAPPHAAAPMEVACVPAPWARAEVLRVTGALPKARPLDGGRPWALRLANGARCVAATGTVPHAAGVDLGFQCGHGADAGLLPGHAALRTAEYGNPDTGALRRVSVTTIWRS
jgi:hypothetical protein